ncbi:alpha/beta hydrolase-fold protein [Membranihabitans maritimus]|uniref:alpha/beta hydrolase-fold protein n=1 Tax=Membranihabitans maritimus TaxID=2904244 RepID=UPI001F189429|nr:alpha/beta hydrolase-fold protein [Membranihabitans maritimus]
MKGFHILIFLSLVQFGYSQQDMSHYSEVFGRDKPYRIFLPESYQDTERSYPVIYYFHGNKGSHKLTMDGVAEWVNANDIIIVAWNGKSVPEDIRPYNIGFHSNINYEEQFKDYFLELVEHIDTNYRTQDRRESRGVIGHSMGGIMSFFLAGKYPHMISASANSKGSPEFFIGYPDNHTLYSVRYLFKNLLGVRLKFYNSTEGELVHLNKEVHNGAIREKELKYEYEIAEGGHQLQPELFNDALNFIASSFKQPLSKPERWHHADLYADFDVWGYSVRSNKKTPGFIELSDVTQGGFEIATRGWLPLGDPLENVELSIATAGIYTPDTEYNLLDYNKSNESGKVRTIKSDHLGKINLDVDYKNRVFGIFQEGGPAEIVSVDYLVNGEGHFLQHNEVSQLKLKLLNRGGSDAENVKVTLSTENEDVKIKNKVVNLKGLESTETEWIDADFLITAENKPVIDGSPFRVLFNIRMEDENGNTWTDEIDIPVFYDVPVFTNIGIDDGDSEIFGSGNGNNIAEPGERIMIYEVSHRSRLYYDDPYVKKETLHIDLQPDKWGDGYAASSLLRISEDCPPGHQIRFLANYEEKEWKTIRRNVYWGTFTITVGANE